jgi:hypothetical protein
MDPAPYSLRRGDAPDRRLSRTALVALAALGATGCFTDADGRMPDLNSLYFPTALVASPGLSTLYVANSDFDLQYSGGWVQALDLAKIRSHATVIADALAQEQSAAEACRAAGRTQNTDSWLHPGPCSAFPVAPYVIRNAAIGAFASGLLLTHNPEGEGARLFTSVRGDPSITYFDVHDDRGTQEALAPSQFRLECAAEDDGFCGNAHRLGQDRDDTLRGIQLPADPVGLAATKDGVAIVAAHQSQSAASLVVNSWQDTPYLSYFASNLASGPTEVAAIPEPAFVAVAETEAAAAGITFSYQRGFAVTFRNAAELTVMRYVPDSGAVPPRPFIQRTASVPITANADGADSRGVAILDRQRRECELACNTVLESLNCLTACAEQVPMQIFIANRSPASLVIGQIETFVNTVDLAGESVPTSTVEEIYFYDSVPLGFGPSRVEVGQIIGPDGQLEDRIFAVCFDSRRVFSFDPVNQRIDSVIHTGRGPHDIAFDTGVDAEGEPFSLMVVGHFTDSYLGVVDLDMRRPLTFGQMFASVGTPTPPKESK